VTRFEVLESWKNTACDTPLLERKRGGVHVQRIRRSIISSSFAFRSSLPFLISTDSLWSQKWFSHMALSPNTPPRFIWDFLSCIFVMYDIIVIPLALLHPPASVATIVFGWITRLFWSFDVPLSFCTGYVQSDGQIEVSPKEIAKRYLRTWFLLDFVILVLDWYELRHSSSPSHYSGLGKASRSFRMIRMVRLLRVLRINKKVEKFVADHVQSERLSIIIEICKDMAIIVGLAHFIACFWFGITGSTDTEGHGWVKEYQYSNSPLSDRYAISMHWSLSQFAGGMDEVTPTNVSERSYAICVFLIAFIIASIFLSSITSSMTQLHMIDSQQSQRISVLKKYLGQMTISKSLTGRILHNAQHTLSEHQRYMPEVKVELLTLLSEPLRVELHFEIYCEKIKDHPFFARYI